jgi:hypothetical protein
MGSITRSLSNNITTGGVILPAGITNSSVSAVTSFANASAGTLILINTQTASSSATISFTTGLDSTYDVYIFNFINIHSSGDNAVFEFNGSTDSGSYYNVTKTTTAFRAIHNESDTFTGLGYDTGGDLAQSTAFQRFMVDGGNGNGNDENLVATLQLFNPSSTTYVKHFIITSQTNNSNDYSNNTFVAGYFNTTSAINAIRFQFASGNIDDGIIKLYGVKKS